uniref:AprI/Inh family metalloprotease inhibitor n=1 Tax=Methylobacterium sp. Leaf118 TaxID=2876562 RepID=UPI001E3D0801
MRHPRAPRPRIGALRPALLALLLLAGAPALGQEAGQTTGQGSEQEAGPQAVTPPVAPGEGGPSPLPDSLAGAVGTWDLALTGGQRRCVLTLSTDSGPSGRLVRFPAGCRRALPLLAGIGGWLYTEAGIRLVDGNVRPVLAFARSRDGQSLAAAAENGDRYSLVPLQIAAMRPATPTPEPAEKRRHQPHGGVEAGPREALDRDGG